MKIINLTYVITTFNKLPYLKEVIRLLLQHVNEDEEIVVTDGASSDGTVEFLTNLFNLGKINQFVSERDCGEAHGFNKALLMAKGTLIKIITDDDIYNYAAIKQMKIKMLQNPELDALSGNIISVNVKESPTYFDFRKSYQIYYERWLNGDKNATFFSCLPLMIRREKLSLIGLFDTSFKHVDLEYSVRLTSQNRKVGFFEGLVSIGLVNNQSISAQEESYTYIFKNELNRLHGNFSYSHLYGIKSTSIPWLRKNILEKNSLLWRFAEKLKLFQTKTIFYPQQDIKIAENMHIPTSDVSSLFQYFEKYLEIVLIQFEKEKFITQKV